RSAPTSRSSQRNHGISLRAPPSPSAQLEHETPCIAKTTLSVRGIIHHDTIARYLASHRRDPNRDEHAASDTSTGVFTETTGEAPRTQGRFGRRRVEPADDGARIPRNRRDDRFQDSTKAARRGPSLPDHPT